MKPADRLMEQFPGSVIIAELIAGSHMYGTSNENSDTDTRGIFIPPVENILGMSRVDQFSYEPEDIKYYSLHYFMHLVVKGVMDAHDWLWADSYIQKCPIFDTLVEHREKFLSSTMGKKIFGYMYSADRRIDRGDPATWGAKRKKLFHDHGYDTKDASHAVRLAYQGIRLYDEGVFYPKLPETQIEEVMSIKRGEFTIGYVREKVQTLKEKFNEAMDRNKAGISQKPDTKFANQLLIDTYRQFV